MFTQGDLVIWWRASPWGPACGIVVKDEGGVLEVLEGERTLLLYLPGFSPEHAPRVVGRVKNDAQPAFARPEWGPR
jgi:hypothetical protein